MKGILLAGGLGTRLYPLTTGLNKQMLPVYNKPMIYYPLSILMLAGIREILVISNPDDVPRIRAVLGDGAHWGLQLSYAVQEAPRGIAEAFLIGREFLAGSPACLVLGDNLFYGRGLPAILRQAAELTDGAIAFACPVADPTRFGIVAFDEEGRVVSLEEKPKVPQSNFAVIGLYFYDANVCQLAAQLKPSRRGELEITDLNKVYLAQGKLQARVLGRGTAWMDAGTPQALLEASAFVAAIETRQGLLISSPEEIALRMGFVSLDEYRVLLDAIPPSDYRDSLVRVLQDFPG